MNAMASAGKSSRLNYAGRKRIVRSPKWVVCVDNDSYEVSLERGKIYRVVPDRSAIVDGLLRVIDESGEDYLFDAEMFVPIDIPLRLSRALSVSEHSTKARKRRSSDR